MLIDANPAPGVFTFQSINNVTNTLAVVAAVGLSASAAIADGGGGQQLQNSQKLANGGAGSKTPTALWYQLGRLFNGGFNK